MAKGAATRKAERRRPQLGQLETRLDATIVSASANSGFFDEPDDVAYFPKSFVDFLGLALGFALGVNGLGGVFRSRSNVSSSRDSLEGFGMGDFDLRKNNQEAALEIGFLAMFTANLGVMLIPIFSALLDDEITAHTICIKIDNISAKLDILFQLAEEFQNEDPFAKAIFREKDPILAAIATRNRLSHSLFVSDRVTDEPQLYENLVTDRRGKPKVSPLNALAIKSDCDALDSAVQRILIAGGDRIKDPFEGHLVLPTSRENNAPTNPARK